MNNRDVRATWKYHDDTKHSPWSVRNNPHFLDFANRPLPFKLYPTLEPRALPRDLPQTGVTALSAIADAERLSRTEAVPDLHDVARILYFSAGITKQRAYPGGEIYFRAAACTGDGPYYRAGKMPEEWRSRLNQMRLCSERRIRLKVL